MSFNPVESAKGRPIMKFDGVQGAITLTGGNPRKSTVRLFLSHQIMARTQFKVGNRVRILVGSGDQFGKVRVEAVDAGGDVSVARTGNQETPTITSRLFPTGGVERRLRGDLPVTYVDRGLIEVIFPWLMGAEFEETLAEASRLAVPEEVARVKEFLIDTPRMSSGELGTFKLEEPDPWE